MGMKHKAEILIDADRAAVWRFFDDPNNMTTWQPALKSIAHKSGSPGQPGAISELVYDENDREVVMTETITARRAPSFLGGTYESKWATAVIVNYFEEADAGQTRWVSNANYRFKGFMKVRAFFIRKSICNRIDTDMNRFKFLVETELAGNAS